MNTVTSDVKPISKYQQKQLAREDRPVPAPIEVVVGVIEEPKFNVANLLMNADELRALQEMADLRTEAREIWQSAKSANGELPEFRKRCAREAEDFEKLEPRAAGTNLYNRLRNEITDETMYKELRQRFLDIQNATDDTGKKLYQVMIDNEIQGNPKMLERHLNNLELAKKARDVYSKKEADVEALFEKGRALFAQANKIAALYGWTVTEPVSKTKK